MNLRDELGEGSDELEEAETLVHHGLFGFERGLRNSGRGTLQEKYNVVGAYVSKGYIFVRRKVKGSVEEAYLGETPESYMNHPAEELDVHPWDFSQKD